MPKSKTNKTEIIEKAMAVFRQRGYHATSMAELALACGLQKGSFYHYFKNKEDLMREILMALTDKLEKSVFTIAYESKMPAYERMLNMLKKLQEVLLDQSGGCLIGNTTLETSTSNGPFNDLLRTIFDKWTDAFTFLYKCRYSESEALKLAQLTIMEFEGAIMFSQLYNDKQFLKEIYIKTLLRLQPIII